MRRPAAWTAAALGLALAGPLGPRAAAQSLREGRTLPDANVRGLAFSPDGKTLAGAVADGSVKLWDPGSGTLRRSFAAHEGRASSISYSRDGALLATCCGKDRTLKLWSGRTGALLRTVTGVVGGAMVAPDGKSAAGGVDPATAGLWDPATGLRLFTFHEPVGEIAAAAFAPGGAILAIAGTDTDLRFWSARTGALEHTLQDLALTSFALAYSGDGRWLAAGSADGTISLWDVHGWTRGRTLGQPSDHAVDRVAFSPDGSLLASCRSDTVAPSNPSQLELWNLATGERSQVLTPHPGEIYAAVFAPDGARLATAGADQAVRLWSVVRGHNGNGPRR